MFQEFHIGGTVEPGEPVEPGAEDANLVEGAGAGAGAEDANLGAEVPNLGAVVPEEPAEEVVAHTDEAGEPVDSDEDTDVEDTDDDTDEDSDEDNGTEEPTGTEEHVKTGAGAEVPGADGDGTGPLTAAINFATNKVQNLFGNKEGEVPMTGGGRGITSNVVKNITADDFKPIKTNIKNLDKEVTKYFKNQSNESNNTLENILTTGLTTKVQKIKEHVFSTKVADLVYYSILTKSYLEFESQKGGLDKELKTKYGDLIEKYTKLINLIEKVKKKSNIPEKRKTKIAVKIDKANTDSNNIGITDNIFIQLLKSKKDFLYRNDVKPDEYKTRIENRERGDSFKNLDLKIPTVIFQNSYSTAWLLSQILFIIMNKDTFKNSMGISDDEMNMSAEGVLKELCKIMTDKKLLNDDLKELCKNLGKPERPPPPQTIPTTPTTGSGSEAEDTSANSDDEEEEAAAAADKAAAELKAQQAAAAAAAEIRKAAEEAAETGAGAGDGAGSGAGAGSGVDEGAGAGDGADEDNEGAGAGDGADEDNEEEAKKAEEVRKAEEARKAAELAAKKKAEEEQAKKKLINNTLRKKVNEGLQLQTQRTMGVGPGTLKQGGAKKTKKNKRGGSSKKRKTLKKQRK